MKEFWNERYAEEEWAYGKEPNVFLREQLVKFSPGSILLPADGEGRNAVFAAQQGWEATAIDLSEAGRSKAIRLACERGVEVDYTVADLNSVHIPENKYDAVALVFAHFPPALKTEIHHKLAKALKPGGHVILEGFSVDHLHFNAKNPAAGGPRNPEMLFRADEMEFLFPDFETLILEKTETTLSEGLYHVGLSSVVRYVGRKKSA